MKTKWASLTPAERIEVLSARMRRTREIAKQKRVILKRATPTEKVAASVLRREREEARLERRRAKMVVWASAYEGCADASQLPRDEPDAVVVDICVTRKGTAS